MAHRIRILDIYVSHDTIIILNTLNAELTYFVTSFLEKRVLSRRFMFVVLAHTPALNYARSAPL